MSRTFAAVKSVAVHLPAGRRTNDELAEQFGVDAGQILDKLGVGERRIAAEGETAADLGVAAARNLFESGACRADEVDFLLFCTQSPDYLTPTSACLMQAALGLRTDSGAIDINQGCSGYVYSLSVAKGLVETGAARNVLLVTGDTYTKLINPRDRQNVTLFGDGATATLVSGEESGEEMIGPFVFGTDGRGAEHLIAPASGLRRRVDAEALIEREDAQGNWRSACQLYMNGGEVFGFTVREVPRAFQSLLDKSGLTVDDLDHVVFHQASKFLLERLRMRMRIPAEKFFVGMEETGNTVSSTIPIALEKARRLGRIKSGDRVALVGFGVGFSWAATVVRIV